MEKITSTRRPKNKAEALFYDYAISKGWNLTKRGWPDFFCWKDKEFILVEVKRSRGKKLKKHQQFIMKRLSEQNIKCYRWDSESKEFQKINSIDPLSS